MSASPTSILHTFAGISRLSIPAAHRVLKASAAVWFLTALIGQWIFAYYILDFYGGVVAQGNLETWNKRLFRGLIEGDIPGNIVVSVHLLLAFIITFCGPFQLVPQIRNRFPAFHRMNGHIYMAAAFAISAAGFYLILARGGVSLTGDISLGLNGLLIVVFAALALRHAIARNIDDHRKWALRLFLVVNGFLAARAGFQVWFFLTGGIGHTNTYEGPFDIVWGFGNYLLPLTVLELYLYTQNRAGAYGKYAMAGMLLVMTMLMSLGIFLAIKNMWLPAIAGT